jgi:pyruvate dehydrogenase E1 component
LRQGLGMSSDMFVKGSADPEDLRTIAGRRIPIVSVADGETGLLDNIGSIIGVKQIDLGVRKHSRCGRPSDVYRYHHIDSVSVMEACGRALAETAMENLVLPSERESHTGRTGEWRDLWPDAGK